MVPLVLARGKSNRLRPRDRGVVVRLLEDIPKFGRKGRARPAATIDASRLRAGRS